MYTKKYSCHQGETHIFEQNASLHPNELFDEHVGAHQEANPPVYPICCFRSSLNDV